MATPHNSAENGEIANTVLMPGDPVRARWIAENFMDDAKLVSDVRNIYCFTGYYRDRRISVMASGMGMPSIGIYSYELYKFYDVDTIIRIGSAGAYQTDLKLRDIVLADRAWSESTYGQSQNMDNSEWKYPSQELNERILMAAQQSGTGVITGPVHSSDVFYHEPDANEVLWQTIRREGLLCVEMESYALFHNAALFDKEAACLLTISDSLVTGESLDSDKRAESFSDMVVLALEAAVI